METDDKLSSLSQYGIDESHWKNATQVSQRIVKITTEKGDFWLKKAAPARGIFRYHALNLFSRILRLPLLKAVPQPGGKATIKNEIERIQLLAADGILVPEIIASDDSWFLIKSMGTSIVKALKQESTPQLRRQQLLTACLSAMKQVHQKNQCLSQAFIRNMVLHDAKTMQVAFIDFEDDPLTVMNLAEAQARDVLLMVNSTARFFVDDQNFFTASIQQFISHHDAAMIAALRNAAARLQWLTRIPFQKLLGHDYQKLKTGILALKDF